VSDNSGNGAFGRPILPGYTVEWHAEAEVWVATSESGPELRGRDQRELESARNQRAAQIGDDIMGICRYAATHGYPPPPQP
jgi:hypothetical protein